MCDCNTSKCNLRLAKCSKLDFATQNQLGKALPCTRRSGFFRSRWALPIDVCGRLPTLSGTARRRGRGRNKNVCFSSVCLSIFRNQKIKGVRLYFFARAKNLHRQECPLIFLFAPSLEDLPGFFFCHSENLFSEYFEYSLFTLDICHIDCV